MSMTRVLYGLAALPLLAGVALAETPKQSNDSKALAKQPMQLSEKQMDGVTAGWDLREIDIFNTGVTYVSIWERAAPVPANPVFPSDNTIVCPGCYLLIVNPSLSVGSQFGR